MMMFAFRSPVVAWAAAVACGLVIVCGSARAATIYKASNDDNIDLTTSWWTTATGTTNPTSIDTADTLWFGSGMGSTRTVALGGNLAVGAIRVDNNTGTPNYAATISSGNTLTLNGNNDYTITQAPQGVVLNSSVGGSLTIEADIAIANTQTFVASRNLTISGGVDLGANTLRFWPAGGTTTVSGAISGTGGISRVQSGTGSLVLSGVNTFTGNINNSTSGIITISGAGQIGGGSYAGTIATTGQLNVNTSADQTLSGVISGIGGNIYKLGSGTLTLTAANTYTNYTAVGQGTLRVTGSGVLGGSSGSTADTGNIWFTSANSGGRLEFETVANLGAADQVRFRNTGGTTGNGGGLVYIGSTNQTLSKTLQCDSSIGIRLESDSVGGSLTFNGSLSQTNRSLFLGGTGTGNNTFATAFTGSGVLTKRDAGTWILSAANTYSGATTISGGTLLVNGSLGNTSGVSVASGAVLGGTGSMSATISGAGLVSPGNSPGITTATAVDPSGGTAFAFEFTATGSPDYSNASASVNDVLRLTDGATPFTSSLSGANVLDIYFDVSTLSGGDTFKGGFYTDLQADFLTTVQNGSYSYWVKGDGTGTDRTFNGQSYFSLANFDSGLSVTLSTVAETAAFASGTANGQVTQFVIVPEPATMILVAAALGMVVAMRRRFGCGDTPNADT